MTLFPSHVVGLVCIVTGVLALWFNGHVATSDKAPRHWRLIRIAALGLGMLLAVSQFFFAFIPGYALNDEGGEGTVVGFPFYYYVHTSNMRVWDTWAGFPDGLMSPYKPWVKQEIELLDYVATQPFAIGP